MNSFIEYVDGMKIATCLHCGKNSQAERVTRTFCGLKCKNAYHAERRKRTKDIETAFRSLETLISNLPHAGDSDEFSALIELQSKIANALKGVEK